MSSWLGHTFGKYQLTEYMGKGALAELYKAYHPGENIYAMVRIFHAPLTQDAGFPSRFAHLQQTLRNLQHPNLVQVFEMGMQDNVYYMVTEFIQSTHTLLDARQLSLQQAIQITIQLADALHYVHLHEMTHSNVKIDEILLPADDRPMLTDFGMAYLFQSSKEALSPRTDIYDLGLVLYRMLTGKLPGVPVMPPRVENPSIPESVERVILKALAPDPNDRFFNAGEMRDILRETLQGMVYQGKPQTPARPGNPYVVEESVPAKKRGASFPIIALIVAALGCVFIAAAALVGFLWLRSGEVEEVSTERVIAVEATVPMPTAEAAIPAVTEVAPPESEALPADATSILSDMPGDVYEPFIDVLYFSSTRDGEMLEGVFTLRDLPDMIKVNRPGIGENFWEYGWEVLVDIEGDGINDYSIAAIYMVQDPENTKEIPFGEGLVLNVLKAEDATTSITVSEDVTFSFDTEANTITLAARIPLLNENSRVYFQTSDYNDSASPDVWG